MIDNETSKVLAFAFTGERVSIERIGGYHKCCVNLSGELLVLDYESMTVVACQPIIWEIIELYDSPPSDQQLDDLFLSEKIGLNSDFFKKPIIEALVNLSVNDHAESTLRIMNVEVNDEARTFMTSDQLKHMEAYKRWMAAQYGSFLISELNIALMPYCKDAANAKMSLRFASGEMLEFMIPESTYGLDISLIRFKRVVAKETLSERLLVYGAYINTKLYLPEMGKVYFDEVIKKGISMTVPQSQKDSDIDDSAMYQDVLKNLFIESTEVMRNNKIARKKVIEKCERK